jgi:uncharacterized protein YegP (UPF0339 family)
MAGSIEVYVGADGKFRFRVKASNGEIIASGEGYNSKAACMDGIEALKKIICGKPSIKDLTKEKK